MRAWLLDELTGIDKMRLAEAPDPVPGPGEVVLRVHFASLNPADRYLAEKQYPAKPALPHILGRDGAGQVIEVGSGAEGLAPGDHRILLRSEVGISRHGSFAERVAVPAKDLVKIPEGWSERESAGAPLVYLTAYQALTMWSALPSKAVVLVTGASGGVGVATVQLAVAMGCTVVALSRSREKRKRLGELGAVLAFDPDDAEWRQSAKGALAPRRVDLAVDNIGGRLLPEVIDTLGEHGRVSLVGRLGGPVPSFNTAALFFRRIRMGGVAVGAWPTDEILTAWQSILELLNRTRARPLVDSVFPFEQLPQAFARLAEGPMGKILLQVTPEG